MLETETSERTESSWRVKPATSIRKVSNFMLFPCVIKLHQRAMGVGYENQFSTGEQLLQITRTRDYTLSSQNNSEVLAAFPQYSRVLPAKNCILPGNGLVFTTDRPQRLVVPVQKEDQTEHRNKDEDHASDSFLAAVRIMCSSLPMRAATRIAVSSFM